MATLTPAEKKVRKLARLPENCVCPNCGVEKKLGFSTICIKFLTFVCNECKTSHQAISHRCKSLTMSSWDMKEVDMLENQGGNDRARRTWLKNAPPCGSGGRPKPGSDINIYKTFIVDAYERQKYYGEDTGASATVEQQQPSQLTNDTPAVVAVAKAPRVAVADLLDFSSAPVSSSSAAAVTTPPQNDPFSAEFGAFHQAPSAAAAPNPSPVPAQPSAPSGAGAISVDFANVFQDTAPPATAPAPVGNHHAFADFSSKAAFSTAHSAAPPCAAPSPPPSFGFSSSSSDNATLNGNNKPIMGNNNYSAPNSNAISRNNINTMFNNGHVGYNNHAMQMNNSGMQMNNSGMGIMNNGVAMNGGGMGMGMSSNITNPQLMAMTTSHPQKTMMQQQHKANALEFQSSITTDFSLGSNSNNNGSVRNATNKKIAQKKKCSSDPFADLCHF